MDFHVFAYLSKDSHQTRVEQLVTRFGVVPPNSGYRNYLKSPSVFLDHLHRGIYTDFVEHEPGRARPLATVVSTGEGVHKQFTFEVTGAFSPERKRLAELPVRSEAQEKMLDTLSNATQTYVGDHGFSSAQPNQLSLAKEGWVVITLGSFVITDDHARRGGRDGDEMHREQRNALFEILSTLEPDFAFSANEDDYELWHEGSIEYFPPLEPWRYLWSFVVFGPERVRMVGRETLMSAPATEVYPLDDVVVLQAFDYLFHPREQDGVNYRERERQACELMKYLGVALPYTTFVSAKDLSSCNEEDSVL